MHRLKASFLLVVGSFALVLAGCTTIRMGDVKPLTEGELKPLQLRHLTKIVIKGPGWPIVKWPCTLPSGVYKARFRDKQGAYYESETHIFLNGGLMESGGIFLPDQHEGYQSAMLWTLGSGIVQRFPIADTTALEGQFKLVEKPNQ